LFSTTAVDYAVVTQFKRRLLETAWSNFTAGGRADLRRAFSEFCEREAHWQDDYALFRALKARFGSASYLDTRAWFEALPDQQRQNMRNCLKRHTGVSGDVAPALIQLAWGSAAELAIAALQDLLDLGSDARMNQPGQAEGNWQWRCAAATLTPVVWRWLRDLTLASDRALVVAQNPGPTGWRSSRRRAPSSGGRHKEVPCVSVSPPITAGST
jgi:4-alpha-glucanotransferase